MAGVRGVAVPVMHVVSMIAVLAMFAMSVALAPIPVGFVLNRC
jgi:hypothetical protein